MVTTMIFQDLLAILPMMDDLILLDVSGEMIHKVRKQSCSCSSAHTWRLSKILFLRGPFIFSWNPGPQKLDDRPTCHMLTTFTGPAASTCVYG